MSNQQIFSALLAALAASATIYGAPGLTLTPSTITVTLHEPVVVQAIITNGSALPFNAFPGQGYDAAYRVQVLSPDGRDIEAVRRSPAVLDGPGGWVIIGPSESRTTWLPLNEWLPFDMQGEYRIKISLPGIEGVGQLQVIVEPPNASRLQETCQSLLSRAQNVSPSSTSDYYESEASARALSFVTDDAAVPFLATLAGSSRFETFGIEGLTRIGSRSSVHALENFLQSTRDPLWANLARMRLNGIASKTDDVPLKAEILRVTGTGQEAK